MVYSWKNQTFQIGHRAASANAVLVDYVCVFHSVDCRTPGDYPPRFGILELCLAA